MVLTLINNNQLQGILKQLKKMRKQKSKPSPNKQNGSKDHTYKKLQFLLPSSKQIILVNSSIKYNPNQYNKEFCSKKYIKTPSSKNIDPPQLKQNQSLLCPPIKQEFQMEKIVSKEVGTQNIYQGFKIIAQTYSHLDSPIVALNKTASAVFFPPEDEEQSKHLTSLNNIVLSSRRQVQVNKKSQSTHQQLINRVNNLEKIVSDIISGKISIQQISSPQQKSLVPKKNKSSLKLIEQKSIFKDKRSASCEQATHQMNKVKSKTKLRLDTGTTNEDKKDTPPLKKTQQLKPFSIKKKNTLKIGSNYQPVINYPNEQFSQLKNISTYASPITDSSQKTNAYSKLKLRVNFMPNIINL